MSSNFKKEYIETRDDAFKDIKSSSNEWNKFIKFWSRLIDKHSIDNILNIYSYNPYGRIFKTFDEWNSDDIDRRIKPKSRGIPILDNDNKTYVFEIGQTYGKDYYEWTYNHIDDDIVLNYYQDKIGIKKDKSLLYNQNFYNTFKTITKDTIIKNYLDICVTPLFQ